MSFFGKSLQNPLLRIRKEPIPDSPSSRKPRPSTMAPSRKAPPKSSTSRPQKRKRAPPADLSTPFADSSSEEEEDPAKRSRSASAIPRATDVDDAQDPTRVLPAPMADAAVPIIHAADVASLHLCEKFEPALGASRHDDLEVRLSYPGAPQVERYQLVHQKDTLDPVQEILSIVETLPSVYLTPAQAHEFTDPEHGLIRQLQRARNLQALDDFKAGIDRYNARIQADRRSGLFARNLGARHALPHAFVRLLLEQIYDRAVSPAVDTLTRYRNGTDNVYGELKPNFIARLLAAAGLRARHIFLDLGSGCGNVVLQAALQVGCESWGCEMMPNACALAARQQAEFAARCRLWGVQPGPVRLEAGDFLENEATQRVLRKADVVLVNNQAFTPKLNDKLKMLFLDLKPGCRVISLKPFGRVDGGGSGRNENDLGNIFGESRRGHFYANDVSWTDGGIGDYYIATRRAV